MKIIKIQILDKTPGTAWLMLECGHIIKRHIEWKNYKDIQHYKNYTKIKCSYCDPRNKEFLEILKNEGLNDWTITFNTGGGLCVYSLKEIWLNEYPSNMALFLHEVAHALGSPKTNKKMGDETGHHSIWGDKYTSLVKKYMIYGVVSLPKELQ